jgi:hypothetical protein
MQASVFLIIWNLYFQQVAYHTPPRFPLDVMENIRKGASLLFQRLCLTDFARIDGWFLPNLGCKLLSAESGFGRTDSGTILFTDINLVRWISFLGGISNIFGSFTIYVGFSQVLNIIFITCFRSVVWNKPVFYFSKLLRYFQMYLCRLFFLVPWFSSSSFQRCFSGVIRCVYNWFLIYICAIFFSFKLTFVLVCL